MVRFGQAGGGSGVQIGCIEDGKIVENRVDGTNSACSRCSGSWADATQRLWRASLHIDPGAQSEHGDLILARV